MTRSIAVTPKIKPPLDSGFIPAALWNRAYRELANDNQASRTVTIALLRDEQCIGLQQEKILPSSESNDALTLRYLERLLKFLLWQKGGAMIRISGADDITQQLAAIYSPGGGRSFDHQFMGQTLHLQTLSIETCAAEHMPACTDTGLHAGRNLDGCRIGFDLGGSDRKAAALIDGEVVFSEEIQWSPYFETDPDYHIRGIEDSLRRAAAHLPRVDAIGGSAAGTYINNEVRAASLFRGIAHDDFARSIRPLFIRLKEQWGNIPLQVINDGEVTALAASMWLGANGVLGLSLGTSLAAGYVRKDGSLTPWLNELAFAPMDYREDAPADEWSGDIGCGVQYFSQQAVARLASAAGFGFAPDMPFPEQLVQVQQAMEKGSAQALAIYRSIGVYLGYSIAHYADFYAIDHLLILGRVTSGKGGDVIIAAAKEVLEAEFPALASTIQIHTPDESQKRHGQAIAAASLPEIHAQK